MSHLACSELILRCCDETTCGTSSVVASFAIKFFEMQSSANRREAAVNPLGGSPPASAFLKSIPNTKSSHRSFWKAGVFSNAIIELKGITRLNFLDLGGSKTFQKGTLNLKGLTFEMG
jgi:hypothetical protein